MELFLNVLWGVIACAAFLILLPRSRGRAAAAIGITCVAALLFPIISVSDDLCAARDALEETAAVRRSVAAPDLPAVVDAALMPAVAAARIAVLFAAIGLVDVRSIAPTERLLTAECDPRSPPS